MRRAVWLLLWAGMARASLDQPEIIRPGTPEERAHLTGERSALREIGYDPLCPHIRVADGTMHYTYRFAPGRGRRAWLLVGVSSQFAISARAEGQTAWQPVADMDTAERLGTRVYLDLTPFTAQADAVEVRFADKHPDDGWGALTAEILYYHDDQPGPLRLDVPADGRFEMPAAWRGQELAVYLPGAARQARQAGQARLNGQALRLNRTWDGGWWADISRLARVGTNTLNADGPARVGLRLPACAASPEASGNHAHAPYAPESLDLLAGNYLQGLLDPRYDLLAFTAGERQPIHFVHDTLRSLSALAEEARRTPIARPELAARLYRGCRAAILPGGEELFAFKHDERPLAIGPLPGSDDLTLTHKVDVARHVAAVGAWRPDQSRVVPRTSSPAGDADRPPRFDFEAGGAFTVRVGRLAEEGMWFRPGSWGPETMVERRDETPYLLIRGGNTGQQTFCRALLIGWNRAPQRIRLGHVPGGRQGQLIDEVLLDFDGRAPVSLVVYPFAGQTEQLATARAVAENIRRTGRLGCGRFDPVETASACGLGPEGIAAAAWLLRRHDRPEAAEAEALALRLMRAVTDLDRAGTHTAELYNLVDALVYLAELGHREWLPWLTIWGERILALQQPDGSYTWLDYQLRMMMALLKLEASTGDPRYRTAFDRALATVGYRDGRLVWKGEPQEAGDFAGALTTALYGRLGRRDLVQTVLSVRTAYIDDRGFQACSDLNSYMLGFTTGLGPKPAGRPLVLGLGEFAQPTPTGPVRGAWPTAYVVNPFHPYARDVRFALP